jgi:hypothetical protein
MAVKPAEYHGAQGITPASLKTGASRPTGRIWNVLTARSRNHQFSTVKRVLNPSLTAQERPYYEEKKSATSRTGALPRR